MCLHALEALLRSCRNPLRHSAAERNRSQHGQIHLGARILLIQKRAFCPTEGVGLNALDKDQSFSRTRYRAF